MISEKLILCPLPRRKYVTALFDAGKVVVAPISRIPDSNLRRKGSRILH